MYVEGKYLPMGFSGDTYQFPICLAISFHLLQLKYLIVLLCFHFLNTRLGTNEYLVGTCSTTLKDICSERFA